MSAEDHELRENPANGELVGWSDPSSLLEPHDEISELVDYHHSGGEGILEVVPIYRGKSKFAVTYYVGDEDDCQPEHRLFDNLEDARKFESSITGETATPETQP